MSKIKSRWLDKSLFISPINYALCLTESQMKDIFKQTLLPKNEWPEFTLNNSHATAHFYGNDESEFCIICINSGNKTLEQIHALLTHEAVHLWQKIKLYINENEPSKEFEAYALQNLTQSLFEAYKRLSCQK